MSQMIVFSYSHKGHVFFISILSPLSQFSCNMRTNSKLGGDTPCIIQLLDRLLGLMQWPLVWEFYPR